MVTVRRTQAITDRVRARIVEEIDAGRFVFGKTVHDVADEFGLTDTQVRDAIWSERADSWRRRNRRPPVL